MILVDTSVWIDFFNDNDNDKAVFLKQCLIENTDICLTDIILTEVLQGIKNDGMYDSVKTSLLSLSFFHAKYYQTYINASHIYRECRKNGLTIRKSNDCIIGAIVLENNLKLLTHDKDFNNIAKVFPIAIIGNHGKLLE